MAITLKVEKRDLKADVEALRKAGNVPAVFYGKKEASTPITVSTVDFIKAYQHLADERSAKAYGVAGGLQGDHHLLRPRNDRARRVNRGARGSHMSISGV